MINRYCSAAHEAAHAVVAILERIPVREVRLDPKPQCVCQVPDLDRVMTDPRAWAMVGPSCRVALAGLAADAIMGRDQEQGYAEGLGGSSDLLAASDMVGALDLQVDEFIDSAALYLERQAGRSRDLVCAHWASIALVAGELERHRILTGASVALIIKTGKPLARPPAKPTYEEWRRLFHEIARPFIEVPSGA